MTRLLSRLALLVLFGTETAATCTASGDTCEGALVLSSEAGEDDDVGLLHLKTSSLHASNRSNTSGEKRIARIIWQTWHDDDLPTKYSETAKKVQTANPTFEYRLVTDEEGAIFMDKYYPGNVTEAYRALLKTGLGAARADLLRYALLYKYGGVYIDLDASCTGLETYIQAGDSAILSHEDWWASRWVQWAMVFEKHHPVLRKAMEIAVERLHTGVPTTITTMHEAVVYTTGPVAFSAAVKSFDEPFFNGHVDAVFHGYWGLRTLGKRMQLRPCDEAGCGTARTGGFAKVSYTPMCTEHATTWADPKKYDKLPLPASRKLVVFDVATVSR